MMCPKEMARPPQARAAGLIERERWMMGGSAPQLPASQPAASSQQQSSQDLEVRSDRVALKIARTLPQLLPVALYIATSLTHLCLAGKGQHSAPGESYIQPWSANARRIRNSAGKVIGLYKSDTDILGRLCRTTGTRRDLNCALDWTFVTATTTAASTRLQPSKIPLLSHFTYQSQRFLRPCYELG